MKQNKIKHIIQVGDLFDRRKYINFLTLYLWKMFFFDYLQAADITMDVIVGNHDIYYKNTLEVNSLALLLGEYDNIRVIQKCEMIERYNTNILMIPWICDDNKEYTLDRIEKCLASVAIGHLELSGFQMYQGQVNTHGMDPKLFEKFELVLSGHYHHKSTIDNITYVGGPYEMVWSDAYDSRGFHVLDCADRSLEYVENPLTLFFKIKYDDTDKTIEQFQAIDFSVYKGTFVKIVVITKNDPFIFDYMVDQLETAGVADLQVVEDHKHQDQQKEEVIINEADDTKTIIDAHIDTLVEGETATKLKDLFQDLLKRTNGVE
jgi:DNA repair exonuclease SbcCD nuclease subunit